MSPEDGKDDPAAKGQVNLVWATPRNREAEWTRFLLGDLLGREVHEPGFDAPVLPNSIYVINTNRVPFAAVPPAFFGRVEDTPGVGVLHLGDEWFGGHYQFYRHFSFVLKTHHPGRFRRCGTLVLPIGWTDGTPSRATVQPASQRRHLWCFMGKLVSSRPEVIRAFSGLERGYVHAYRGKWDSGEALPSDAYHRLLGETAFVPCPMGNVMVETHRFYEALEAGAIPIVEDRPFMPYYETLLGPNPVPKFRSWREARAFIDRLKGEPAALDALQAETLAWWAGCREALRERTIRFVSRGLKREFVDDTRRYAGFKDDWRHKVHQWAELAKHHSLEAGLRRARIMVLRGLRMRSQVAPSMAALGGEPRPPSGKLAPQAGRRVQ